MKKEEKKIELSSFETTAYWWVRLLKRKVRELSISRVRTQNEDLFLNAFYTKDEVEWRKIYLKLAKSLITEVNEYESTKDPEYDPECFWQDTDLKRHNILNRILSEIIASPVPDIRLSTYTSKDQVIYTNMFGASVWYKSLDERALPTKYEPCYLLTGDEEELNFNNLFLSTIVTLKEKDHEFKSISLVKKVFCKEYQNNHPEDNLEEIEDRFDKALETAACKDIIQKSLYGDHYYCHFYDIDLVGLDQYMGIANHYANLILKENENRCLSVYSKKLKNRS